MIQRRPATCPKMDASKAPHQRHRKHFPRIRKILPRKSSKTSTTTHNMGKHPIPNSMYLCLIPTAVMTLAPACQVSDGHLKVYAARVQKATDSTNPQHRDTSMHSRQCCRSFIRLQNLQTLGLRQRWRCSFAFCSQRLPASHAKHTSEHLGPPAIPNAQQLESLCCQYGGKCAPNLP